MSGASAGRSTTPNLDALAADGLPLHQLPRHADVLADTGGAAHRPRTRTCAGVGHLAHSDPGFPGLRDGATRGRADDGGGVPRRRVRHLMVGKWHLARTRTSPRRALATRGRCSGASTATTGSSTGSPTSTNRTACGGQPRRRGRRVSRRLLLHRRHHRRGPSRWCAGCKASNPTKPFFLYFAHGAVHAPLQAQAGDIDKHRDRYRPRMGSPSATARFAPPARAGRGAARRGAATPEHRGTPRRAGLGRARPTRSGELFARYRRCSPAMVDNLDQNFGRLRDALEEHRRVGQHDRRVHLRQRRLARGRGRTGTCAYFRTLVGINSCPTAGSRRSRWTTRGSTDLGWPPDPPPLPTGWAMASNTPVPPVQDEHPRTAGTPCRASCRGPPVSTSPRQVRCATSTATSPTSADARRARRGAGRSTAPRRAAQPLAGASFAASLADADAPSHPHRAGVEMIGHRGFYRDGWDGVDRAPAAHTVRR